MSRSIERRGTSSAAPSTSIGPSLPGRCPVPRLRSDVADDDDVLEPRAVLENGGEQLETFRRRDENADVAVAEDVGDL